MNAKEIKIFNEEEINEWIRNTGSEWSFDGKWIRKTYKTHSWKSTLMVVNAIGHLAELAWHHPDLVVSYAFVEVKLMNHAKKGITQLDFDLAKKIDEFILWNPVEEGLSLEGTPDDPRFAYVKRKK
ncbi:MAG: pterin dehydratase [alpha proteobacterium MED-G10]|nr:pterin dehydratase [Rickettsiales bacterium]PDH56593.1 MAG: pterin dehydratase [alpha proteobacterium MED-G10]|tara:strand:- start:64 stop:441 length:378 start_codon:yes stop_codon:yes gene_type:complete